jgi:Putative zinc-finger
MSTNDSFTGRLSDYLDGEAGAPERAAIEAHLESCAACRETLAELRAVAARASQLPSTPPSSDLWPGVAARIGTTVVPFERRERRFSFTLPQLVAAGLALMLLSGGMVWVARLGDPRTNLPAAVASRPGAEPDAAVASPPAPARDAAIDTVSFADTHFDQAVADLQKTLEEGRGRLDPETVRIIEENLQSIDQAIDQSRKALRADPANVYLNNHFAAARNRKLALLRRATALALAPGQSGT